MRILSGCKAESDFTLIMLIVVGILVFAIMTFIGYALYDNFKTVATSTALLDTAEQEATLAGFDIAMSALDYVIVFFAVAAIIGAGVAAYYLSSAPVFFLISWIMAFFLGALSYLISFFGSSILLQSVWGTTASYFPYTVLLATNLHWFALFYLVVGVIVRYGKRREVQYA